MLVVRAISVEIRLVGVLLAGLVATTPLAGAAALYPSDSATPSPIGRDWVYSEKPPTHSSVLREAQYDSSASDLTRNLRWALDFSSRVNVSTDTGESAAQSFGGLDLHKVFSDDQGDWGTLTLQLYMTRFDNQNPYPFFFEDDDDWELVPRIANFNYTGLGQGRLNLRVGHFEIPYGLEVPISTNGTLYQLMTGSNLGIKVDWGVGLNGTFPAFDYEVTLSRGSGVEYSDSGQPFVVAGRVGVPMSRVTLGVSGFHGQVLGGGGAITTRTRFGPDIQMQAGPFGMLAEISVGEDEAQEVVNTYTELNWTTPDEVWVFYLSNLSFSKHFETGWDEAFTLNVGVRVAQGTSWLFSTQYQQQLETFGTTDRDGILSAQIRYRLH